MSDINLIVKAIKKSLNPKKIILFGSYAKGKNTKYADVDLAVIQKQKPKLGQKSLVTRTLIKMGYNWEVEPDIHLFWQDDFNKRLKNNSFFIKEIMKGNVVYAS